MKKILTLMLAAGMLLGAASGAKAIDFKASGEWLVGFGLGDGSLIKDVDNKIIPTVVAVLGVVVSVAASSWAVTPENILNGAISGLASTGLHQLFKQWIDSGGGKYERT